MKIATVQYDLIWEDISSNLEKLESLIQDVDGEVIILPEMFTTGFTMNPTFVNKKDNDLVTSWMNMMAKKLDKIITGSIAYKQGEKYVNRLLWVTPEGQEEYYDKKHLFRMANEHETYLSGKDQKIVEYKGVKFALNICYDLRFPVWARRTEKHNYDCLLYVANWPAVRSDAWQSLLKARAIENLSYCIGVNRVGEDGNGIKYDGKSSVFDFKGDQLDSHIDRVEGISYATINLQELKEFREKFPAYLDADPFTMN